MSIEFLESDYDKASCLVNLLSARATGLAADDFAIVLYTTFDHGRGAHESQVRQKKGFARMASLSMAIMTKLERENVCLLVKGDIETPNDISGVVYVMLDTLGAWKNEVAKELKACGYTIKSFYSCSFNPNGRSRSDSFSVAVSPSLQNRAYWRHYIRINLTSAPGRM
ncbi:nucleotide-binding protein [Halomonas sp. LR3S48]|uniref:nucleotide-binding protein n=1 Tax=Halomonas sp. LR3S48 TaxID=2982694 RepID=UPI0021E4F8F5|nr:nucleotide-binding protein [Halomonas sp. LR3S48]UYG04570.1 nucleotide-binding protein [Halomonas sp. LR3S48]